ncbi:MAG: O-antigen ligase family protein [Patescibacteria group bacterium]
MPNKTSMNDIGKISRYLFYILLFIPIFFGGGTKELYEFPKTTALYVVGGLMILLFILGRIGRKTTLTIPNTYVVLFVLISGVATILSSHRYTSLWGYYSRFNGGLISTLILFGIYIVVLNKKESYKKLAIEIPLLSAIPITLYSIFQHFSGTERAYATLGQPNWLAAYMVMLIPIMIERYIEGDRKMIVLYALAFSSLWFTYSLSGILGFLVAIIATFLRIKPFPKKSLAVISLITLFIALTSPGIFKEKLSDLWIDISGQLTLIRQASASDEHALSDPGFIRFSAWRGTLDLIKSRPKIFLIGSGPQTFPYEFQKFRPKDLNYSSEWDFIINKPHNYYLELWSEVGIIGLILCVVTLWQSRKNPFLPGIAGYAVTNLFGWPVVPTAVLFWIWLAYSSKEDKTKEVRLPKITGLIFIPLTFLIMYKALTYYSADVDLVMSMTKFKENKLDLSLSYITKAVKKNPNEPNYPKQAARIYTAKSAESPEAKALALENIEKAYALNPGNLATKRDVIPLYFFLAVRDIKLPEGSDNTDSKYLPIAVNYFATLKNEYPTDAGTLVDIARYEKRIDLESYEKTREMVENLRPDIITWHESFR